MKTDPFSLVYCLQLIRSENVGPITFWQLVRQFGSPKSAIDFLQEADSIKSRKISIFPLEKAEQEIEQHHKHKIHLISAYDSAFPQSLKTLPDRPPVLSVRGQLDVLNQPKSIAIVGARNASLVGRNFARSLATDLGDHGWIIVSGLARGIDGSAHLGALQKGTIAVLAGGVDVIYPPEHRDIYIKIQNTGCIISEMPFAMPPSSMHFPRRNRLISGLAQGVIVVEAALKSGSLITANFALDQGKELFAVPGSPADPRCRGTNDLLRRGAYIVESVVDVTSILEGQRIQPITSTYLGEDELFDEKSHEEIEETLPNATLQEQIFQDLSTNPIAIEALAAQYNCSAAVLLAIVLELELSGLIVRSPNGMISRAG